MAGEAMYKVWTQESILVEVRSSAQGLMNEISRIACALFAFVTPALVLPGVIKITLWYFAGIVVISFLPVGLRSAYRKNMDVLNV